MVINIINDFIGTSLAVQWLRLCLPMQAVQVQSLARGTKIPNASWPKTQSIKHRNNIVTNLIDFNKGPHQKNLKKINCIVKKKLSTADKRLDIGEKKHEFNLFLSHDMNLKRIIILIS